MSSALWGRVQRIGLVGAAFIVMQPAHVSAQSASAPKEPAAAKTGTPEQRAARAYVAARANPLELEAFLRRMPKGSDLHYHFPGGIYAETWIRAAAEDGLCVNLATHAL